VDPFVGLRTHPARSSCYFTTGLHPRKVSRNDWAATLYGSTRMRSASLAASISSVPSWCPPSCQQTETSGAPPLTGRTVYNSGPKGNGHLLNRPPDSTPIRQFSRRNNEAWIARSAFQIPRLFADLLQLPTCRTTRYSNGPAFVDLSQRLAPHMVELLNIFMPQIVTTGLFALPLS
jgi:hypothetical protein